MVIIIGGISIGCGYTRLKESTPSPSKYYPADLDIIYRSGEYELNSIEGYLETNAGTIGIVRTTFVLSRDDRIRIYEAIKDRNIDSLPSGGGFGRKSLWIRCEGIKKKLDEGNIPERLKPVLDDILFNSPYFQMLPEYQGPKRL